EMKILHNNLTEIQGRFNTLNVEFYVAIARNKHSLYGQYLPIDQSPSTTTFKQFVETAQHSGVTAVDLSALYDHHRQGQYYYKTDSHWNDL
ncbi:MAG: alginate O-acetyltransferase AlgX-related protein, partial [Owenweeksia sp.]